MIKAKRVDATIPVADLARAVRWYKDKLGLEPTMQDKDMGASYRLPGGSGFFLYPTPTNAGKAPNTLMGFEVASVTAEVAALKKAGVKFENYDMPGLKTVDGIMTMGTMHVAWFKDADGNILSLGDGTP
jgi:catechol 2,3-dioxygenase-like lactoylglutathione lyase family enzyme